MPDAHQKPRPARNWKLALRALEHRNFRLYFGGQGLSVIGTWMTRTAIAWLVYKLTGSAILLGVVAFAGQLPTFLLAPFAGVWVDRLPRRPLLVVTQALAMAESLALAVLAFTHITIIEIIALSAFQGFINAFDMPGRQSFLVDMVEGHEALGNAIALNSSMVNLARLIGPAVAGLIIALWGESWCFLIDGISYIAVLASLVAMANLPQRMAQARRSMLMSLREGWSFVSGFAPARNLLLLVALVSLVGIPYTVLMPLFAGNVLHGGAHTLGFLLGAAGAGALLGAVRLAARPSVRGLTKVVPISAGLFGFGLLTFGLSHWLWLSLPLIFVAGLGMMQQMASTNTILQTVVDDEKRGRVMAFYTMAFVGMAPWGSLLSGWMANRMGAPHTLVLNGAVCMGSAAWFATQLKTVRNAIRPVYQRLGIIPEMTTGIQSAAALTTPPQE
ncbi:MAG: MFS transporter [Terriglobales bacterium]